jgi:YesN/AraC family two-component response regulator
MSIELAEMRERVRALSVLIVEDEAVLRESTVHFFEKVFDHVVGAANGEEALERCKSEAFQLVVSDIRMPGITGLELLEQLRSEQPDLVTVVVSGDYGDEVISEEVVDLVFQKPIAIGDIKTLLERVIEKKGM